MKKDEKNLQVIAWLNDNYDGGDIGGGGCAGA